MAVGGVRDHRSVDPHERFADLVALYVAVPEVTVPQGGGGFGSATLRRNGKIFAFLSKDRLIVKLPADRVRELVREGLGDHYDGRRGRPMREWLSVDASSDLEWTDVAGEAFEFAGPR